MNILRRIRRSCRNLGRLLAVTLVSGSTAAASMPAPPAIGCELSVPKRGALGRPVPLTMRLHNTGASVLHLLTWGTPFEEAWFQPFVEVTHDGRTVSYGGASVKRGEPAADEYLRVAPGQSRQATIDLAEVFDFSVPGRYEVKPRVVLHDVMSGTGLWPRPRAQHQSQPLACRAVTFELRRPR
jgi:hypothetical protein